MKKILLPVLLFIGFYAKAQVCIPNAVTSTANAYILPDSATGINHGCPNLAYTQTMYLKAAKDTTINTTVPLIGAAVLTATIDSFVVDKNISGLPSYLSTQSVPATLPPDTNSPKTNYERLIIKGDSLACVRISGTVPNGTSASTTNLGIKVRIYLSNIHSPNATVDALIPSLYANRMLDTTTTISDYNYIVDPTPCYPTSVSNLEKYNFTILGTVPNPINTAANFIFETTKAENFTIKISNALGEIIYTNKVKSHIGKNYIPINKNNFAKGMYIISISNKNHSLIEKISIQ